MKNIDIPFHGLRPSDACCVCGGGSIKAAPTQLPLSGQALFVNEDIEKDHVNSIPNPMPEAIQVTPGCDLSTVGLSLSSNGRIKGTVKNGTQEVNCPMVVVQDPVRGIAETTVLRFSVFPFTYGSDTVVFASWGLDGLDVPIVERTKSIQPFGEFQDFQLSCEPLCPWLSVDVIGNLQAKALAAELYPTSMRGNLQEFQPRPSCSCRVAANTASGTAAVTRFLAVQTRLWKRAVYKVEVLAQVGVEIPAVELEEGGWRRDLSLALRP